MVSFSHMVREGSSEEEAFKGRLRRRPQQHVEGRILGRGRAEAQPCSRSLLRPWGPRTRPRKEAAPSLAAHQEQGPGCWQTEAWRATSVPSPIPRNGLTAKRGSWGASWTQTTESQVAVTREDFVIGQVQEQTSTKPRWIQRHEARLLLAFASPACLLSLLLVVTRWLQPLQVHTLSSQQPRRTPSRAPATCGKHPHVLSPGTWAGQRPLNHS